MWYSKIFYSTRAIQFSTYDYFLYCGFYSFYSVHLPKASQNLHVFFSHASRRFTSGKLAGEIGHQFLGGACFARIFIMQKTFSKVQNFKNSFLPADSPIRDLSK